MAVERHGANFFESARQDALKILYEPDQKAFCQAFSRANVLQMIDEQGSFTQIYRQIQDGKPVYMSMKAVRLEDGENRLIIGVSNVDMQMRERQELLRQREEQQTYRRLASLGGDYLVFYTVDLETGHFYEFSASEDYERLGLTRTGEDFFTEAAADAARAVYEAGALHRVRKFEPSLL